MNSIFRQARPDASAATQMLWLPGAYNQAQDFLAAGFAQAVQQRNMALDLVFVDLHLAHLQDRTGLQQLRSTIILPARAAGISVWLGGISLGGLFALHYAASYPGELAGLCLLAPYLGNRMLTGEIAAAHGVAAWQPGTLAETDEERRIWSYLKTRRPESEPLYLGFGRKDRFAPAHHLLAATLPEGSVDSIAGDHEWGTWSTLWENFLDSRFICR